MEQTQKHKNNFMVELATFIVDKRNLFFLITIIALIFSAFSRNWVDVENELSFYLPDDAETKQALDVMEEQFTTYGTADVMVANITYEEAEKLNDQLSEIKGVQSVAFDQTTDHYASSSALFTVTFDYDETDDSCLTSLDAVKELLSGYDLYISTDLGNTLAETIDSEVSIIMIYVAIIVVAVLTLTSRTFGEVPVLLLTFLTAMVLNQGSNFLLGKISFVSNSVTSILQLALSLDYAVILCNRFKEEHQTLPIREAAIQALSKAIPEIGASSLTTIGGLCAMLFMQFKIGPDMGICLMKSILFALLSVFVLMPGLLVLFGPLIAKTEHRNFVPKISFAGKFAWATRKIVPFVFLGVIVLGYFVSSKCPYAYGYSILTTPKLNETQIAENLIKDTFTSKNMLALVVPAGDYEKEAALLDELDGMDEIDHTMGLTNVEAMDGYMLADKLTPRQFSELAGLDYEMAQVIYAAYATEQGDYGKLMGNISSYKVPLMDMFLFVCNQVEAGIVQLDANQTAMLQDAKAQIKSAKEQLQGSDYSRMLLYLTLPESGDETYAFIDTIRSTAQRYYSDGNVYVAGNSTTEYDFEKSFSRDNTVVSIVSLLIVLVVLLFTFKSAAMPILLILVIQGSIWINFSIPVLTNSPLFFMSYLVVSSIQMGANIDYAIVIASRYQEIKNTMSHRDAMIETLNFAFCTVITSGTILAVAGTLIGQMTSEATIVGIGQSLGRGTIISIILVLFVLPQILLLGGGLADKTSFSMPSAVKQTQESGRVYINGFVSGEISGTISGMVRANVDGDVNLNVISGSVEKKPPESEQEEMEDETNHEKNKLPVRIFSGLLVLVMLFSLCPAAFAVEECTTIGTLKELKDFAKRCTSDSYSKGLSVILTADIDADGASVSVPVFLGSFDGQGHKITGLRLTESNSTYSLFSRIESGAVVKNLTVEGEVSPSGTQNVVGGIVGENNGTIENCSFSGVVVGSGSVGGIAGSNDGTITGCMASGVVRGTQYTGCIVGQNSGTLLRCENTAAVNTTVSDADLAASDISGLENTFYSILKNEDTTENAVMTDTGGITGFSTGVVQSCTNTGSVGYPHVGYNVGGIVGRQSGYMASCVNRGEIQGRKDVGGIVGQMVPDITLQFSESGLDELQAELNTLQSLINRTLDDAQSGSDSVSGRVSRIFDYADSARDSANSLTDQLGGFVDSNVDTVNNLLLPVERYLAKLTPIMDDLDIASDSVTESIAEMRGLLALLDNTLVYNDTILSQLQSFCAEMQSAGDAMLTGLDAIENTLSLIEGGLAVPDTTQLRSDTEKLLASLVQLNEAIDTAAKEYQDTGSVNEETQKKLNTALQAAFTDYAAIVSDLNDLINNTDFDALRVQNEETLHQIFTSLQTAMDSFYSATSHLSAATGHLYDALGTLRTINDQAAEIFAQLDTTLSAVQQASEAMSCAMSKATQWVRDLSGEDVGSFSPLGTEFSESSNALNTSLGGISNELSALNSEIASSNTVLLSDVRSINNQLMKVMNLFLNMLNDTQNVDYTDVFEDVSEESLQSATRGKVLECTNYGSVTADRNAGGIAGAMAIEYDTDPEDDLLSSQNRSAHFTYQTKAILLDCDNYGSVQAKKSCAGGITGRMDLGTISGCGGWGSVDSESGDYVGGVAGLSLSSVRSSYAKCRLSGGKYVGGIVGSGSRVSDCISMVVITDCTQLGGAVAGEITGDYSDNRFVSDALAGVDRVSYSGKAEQIGYGKLCTIENIPENFLHLTLRFVAEDTVLREQKFDYGASFTEEIYPEIPAKDGCYGQWDTADLTNLHFDTVVTVNYEPYITTLSSDTQREDRAEVLVEGKFRNDDFLHADKIGDLSSAPDQAIEAWSLQIPEDGQDNHTIRWLIPTDSKDNYTVYTLQESGWKNVDSEQTGAYLCFEMTGHGQFAVVPAGHTAWWVWILVGVGCAGVAGVIPLLVNKRKGTK